ncbi:MAG: hypothetical protein ABSG51_03090 [Terracidiphilus sp.]|jgi:hypothetical protein
MNWKRLFKSLLWNSVWLAAFMIAIFGTKGVLQLRPLFYILYLLIVIAVSFNSEGIHNLESRGHVKFLRVYGVGLLLLIVSSLVLAWLGFGQNLVFYTLTTVMLALWVAMRPLALLLNPSKGRSNRQPATDNAS